MRGAASNSQGGKQTASRSLPVMPTLKGRGTTENPAHRFQPYTFEQDEASRYDDEGQPLHPQTVYLRDGSRSIISSNDSPDIPFRYSINPYRGCAHGCIYCYARNTHEYLGFSAGLDFETKIVVKENAADLLRKELSAKRYEPSMLMISGVTDCYQPIERKLQLTRQCLQVCAEFRHPIGIVTKNALVTRDIDVLSELATFNAASVMISVTSLKPDLMRIMEPRTSTPKRRLAAIEALAKAGIPVGVMVAPVVPGLTDEEMPAILTAAASAGATYAGFVPLRLPLVVAPLFEEWLGRHFPDRKEKVLNRVRSMREGKLNDASFGTRMQGHGIFAEQIDSMFKLAARKAGMGDFPKLSKLHFRKPAGPQLNLFEGF